VGLALQAGAVVSELIGDPTGVVAELNVLEDMLSLMATYAHLSVAPASLRGDRDRFLAAGEAIDWFQKNNLSIRLASFLSG
jgi:hypothetical protein